MKSIRRISLGYWLYVIAAGLVLKFGGDYLFGLVPERWGPIVGIPVVIAILALGARQAMRQRKPDETPGTALLRDLRHTAKVSSFILVPAAVIAVLVWVG